MWSDLSAKLKTHVLRFREKKVTSEHRDYIATFVSHKMAKRLHDDQSVHSEAARASKKSKRDINGLSTDSKPKTILSNGRSLNQGVENIDGANKEEDPDTGDSKLSKEERRALKRAKKERDQIKSAHNPSKITVNGADDGVATSKTDRKALKQAEKAARKAEKHALSNGSTLSDANGTANGTADTSVSTSKAPSENGEVPDVVYKEHEELASLPQSEIDAFISDKLLSVEDSSERPYRPIVSFKYLPHGRGIDHAQFENFSSPTPVQSACWPYLFAGRDVIGVAETGSGKTLAFGVPCIRYIARLDKTERKGIRSCVVSPTRELAMQSYEQLAKLAEPAGLKVSCVYGGVSKDVQRQTLHGTHVVVATPGRLNDFVREGSIDLSQVTYLVLDEADRMFEKGFEEEVRQIISKTSSTGRQTLMFTATWPQEVRDLANTFMDKPVKVTIGDNASGELRANANITQEVEVIDEREKQPRLIELLKQYQSGKNKNDRILVFCLYKKEATRIEEFIRRRGFSVTGIHGDLSQQRRTESLDVFKRGTVPVLVATDVAARGLDIPAVKLVINVTFPLTVEDYVHRIGR